MSCTRDMRVVVLQRWLSQVQIFPVELERLIVEFLEHVEIRFQSVVPGNHLKITDNGRRLEHVLDPIDGNWNWSGAVGKESFDKCRHSWRIDFSQFNCATSRAAFGLAMPHPTLSGAWPRDFKSFCTRFEIIKNPVSCVLLNLDVDAATLSICCDDRPPKIITEICEPTKCRPYIAVISTLAASITS